MPGISASHIPIPFSGDSDISWQTYWTASTETLGNYTGINSAVLLYRKLSGNGWISFDTTGLTSLNVSDTILYLSSAKSTKPRALTLDFSYAQAAIHFDSTANHFIRYCFGGVVYVSSVSFVAGYKLGILRHGSTIDFAYNDGTEWVILASTSYAGDLYAGILFYDDFYTRLINNITLGGVWNSPADTSQYNFGEISCNATSTQANSGKMVMVGDGWIKSYFTGKAEAEAASLCMGLHTSATPTANNTTLFAYMFWYATDHKIHSCNAANTLDISDVTWSADIVLRLRRTGGTLYFEYSTDDVSFTELATLASTGNLFLDIYNAAAGVRSITNFVTYGMYDIGLDVHYTHSSNDYRLFRPYDFDVSKKVVLYTHGVGEDEDAPFTDALKLATMNAFIREGWGVTSALAAGENWGNQASLTDYAALLAWARGLYNFTDLDILAQSMGGLSGMQLFMNDAQYGRLIGIYPALNLANMFTTAFKDAIKTAFGFVDDGDYAASTAGHDPMLDTSNVLNNRKMLLAASEGDLTVNKDNNSDLFITNFAADADITLITATGIHGDASHFSPFRDVVFLSKL